MSQHYPEHEKLSKISKESHACGEFLDWLGSKGLEVAKWRIHNAGTSNEWSELVPSHRPIRKLLAEFFEIDEKKIEEEKRAMLDQIRKEQG